MTTTSTVYFIYVNGNKIRFPMTDGELRAMGDMIVPVAGEKNTFKVAPDYVDLMNDMIGALN